MHAVWSTHLDAWRSCADELCASTHPFADTSPNTVTHAGAHAEPDALAHAVADSASDAGTYSALFDGNVPWPDLPCGRGL